MKELLMGNEAVALGAMAAGVQVVSGYPGTPSSEVLETIAKRNPGFIHVEWSVNEKVGVEVAAGAAYTGARSLVTMKQMGLNVASDPVMCVNYIGIKGGMVIYVCDDPGPISSQTEQDTRHFAEYAHIPCFDCDSPEQAFQIVQDAFEFSEKHHTPVILRSTTRVCHACADIEVPEFKQLESPEGFVKDSKWVIFPKRAYEAKLHIVNREQEMSEEFAKSGLNTLEGSGEIGIACGGISYAYVKEAISGHEDKFTVFKVATPYPFPSELATNFCKGKKQILVFEELDPVIEDKLAVDTAVASNAAITAELTMTDDTTMSAEPTIADAAEAADKEMTDDTAITNKQTSEAIKSKAVKSEAIKSKAVKSETIKLLGKRTGDVPVGGELSAGVVAKCIEQVTGIKLAINTEQYNDKPALPVRPPVLCAGCPHRASFYEVKAAVGKGKAIYCGDIGCYTLGNAAPLDMVDTCLCMGAGITMAQGLNYADDSTTNFAFVGDSTFFASGITGVVNAVYNQADMILCVLDNSTTAMTGHQPHPGMGVTMMNQQVEPVDIAKVLEGVGVKSIRTVDPLNFKESVDAVKLAMDERGTRAIIFKSPCIALYKAKSTASVNKETCVGCMKCINEIGCPALIPDNNISSDCSLKADGSRNPDGIASPDGSGASSDKAKVKVDLGLCTGCGFCTQLCPTKAIEIVNR